MAGWKGCGVDVSRWLAMIVQVFVFVRPAAGLHEVPEPVAEWCFMPRYELPRSAANTPGPRPAEPEVYPPLLGYMPPALWYRGMEATDRRPFLLGRSALPEPPFAVEMWIVDHVNRPVGVVASAKGFGPRLDAAWTLGYADDEVTFTLGENGQRVEGSVRSLALKKYWYHVVGVHDGASVSLYVNGTRVGREPTGGTLGYGEETHLEIAGYLGNEPHMQVGNLLPWCRVYDAALDADAIEHRFAEMRDFVERGVLYPGVFHFAVPPALTMATGDAITVVFETDRPSTAVVEYGVSSPTMGRAVSGAARRIHTVRLTGLDASTPYLYRVIAEDAEAGTRIESGTLTFKTAAGPGEAFGFAVIGDTESRPHVNDRIAKLVWGERPDFVLNCGDLTDGGRAGHKFEWNHEYFAGMGQLLGRVASFPVAGNGEGDLHWFTRYHGLEDGRGYYSFRYADAEFFMLDSNRSAADFREGGEQYAWLEERLRASTATWKFAAHHHPTYTSDEDDYGDTFAGEPSALGDENVRRIVDLYERYGVDAVFFGHLHTYERSWPVAGGEVNLDEGVVYVQSGGAGGNLEDFAPTRSWFKHKTMRGHHYCTVNIAGGTMEFKMYGDDGAMRDSFTITKPAQPKAAR